PPSGPGPPDRGPPKPKAGPQTHRPSFPVPSRGPRSVGPQRRGDPPDGGTAPANPKGRAQRGREQPQPAVSSQPPRLPRADVALSSSSPRCPQTPSPPPSPEGTPSRGWTQREDAAPPRPPSLAPTPLTPWGPSSAPVMHGVPDPVPSPLPPHHGGPPPGPLCPCGPAPALGPHRCPTVGLPGRGRAPLPRSPPPPRDSTEPLLPSPARPPGLTPPRPGCPSGLQTTPARSQLPSPDTGAVRASSLRGRQPGKLQAVPDSGR
uniref:Uncharacterized protein n=1 Tax=Mustela putorius furo TaxID=9669 RepID=M3XTR5_MUSPF